MTTGRSFRPSEKERAIHLLLSKSAKDSPKWVLDHLDLEADEAAREEIRKTAKEALGDP